MKKVILLILILFLTGCFFEKEDNKDYKEINIEDKSFGTTTFTYSKDKSQYSNMLQIIPIVNMVFALILPFYFAYKIYNINKAIF